MESEEITKLVDGIYRNVLEKFNPGTTQMINAGKAYLKALHGAAAASRVYVDAITKLARQAQQTTWSGCSDIGSALMQIVDVYKETQVQQMNILKAFYVDVLVPLETNLEKDTKVIQTEQKKFAHQHKQRMESYGKAESLVKKYRKKQQNRSKSTSAMDKELKSMQMLEEEKNKLEEFCEKGLRDAMTQERRRYGFVLERQCSLAKHLLVFHNNQETLLGKYVDTWNDVSKSREHLPRPIEAMFTTKFKNSTAWSEDASDMDNVSMRSQMRESRSIDSIHQDNQSITTAIKQHALVKAKSDLNMNDSIASGHKGTNKSGVQQRPKSMAIMEDGPNTILVRALYAYLANGEFQLSFLEGDVISVIGEKNKGWQFGENLRTRSKGWFPLAYTDTIMDDMELSDPRRRSVYIDSEEEINGQNGGHLEVHRKYSTHKAPVTKFGDSVVQRQSNQVKRVQNTFSAVPPPVAPAPMPQHHNNIQTNKKKQASGNVSLHSSNDSGFSNEPPPAPDVDYSDEDTGRQMILKKTQDMNGRNNNEIILSRKSKNNNNNNKWTEDDELIRSAMHHSVGHLATLERYGVNNNGLSYDQKKIKRTKSLWKFKKDDVLEGMSLWKHRSLVDIHCNNVINNNNTSNGTPLTNKRMSITTGEISVDTSSDDDEDDEDDENVTIMNEKNANTLTLKKKYTNGIIAGGGGGGGGGHITDEPSDPESCIVVEDHRKNTLLPRTHLGKVVNNNHQSETKLENGYRNADIFESTKLQTFKYNRNSDSAWYDSWGERRKK